MDHEARLERPAGRFSLDACKLGLGHAGVMLQGHGSIGRPFASPRTVPVKVATAPIRSSRRHRAISAATSKSSCWTRTVIAQPPVTGGKKAISRAPGRWRPAASHAHDRQQRGRRQGGQRRLRIQGLAHVARSTRSATVAIVIWHGDQLRAGCRSSRAPRRNSGQR